MGRRALELVCNGYRHTYYSTYMGTDELILLVVRSESTHSAHCRLSQSYSTVIDLSRSTFVDIRGRDGARRHLILILRISTLVQHMAIQIWKFTISVMSTGISTCWIWQFAWQSFIIARLITIGATYGNTDAIYFGKFGSIHGSRLWQVQRAVATRQDDMVGASGKNGTIQVHDRSCGYDYMRVQ